MGWGHYSLRRDGLSGGHNWGCDHHGGGCAGGGG